MHAELTKLGKSKAAQHTWKNDTSSSPVEDTCALGVPCALLHGTSENLLAHSC